jgi:hypothetical protein
MLSNLYESETSPSISGERRFEAPAPMYNPSLALMVSWVVPELLVRVAETRVSPPVS